MNAIEWLLEGDPVIQRLTNKYLINEVSEYTELGLIQRYLELFDSETALWGGGVYSPKWISTHYTLMELKYMEIEPTHPYYQAGLTRLMEGLWGTGKKTDSCVGLDLCVLGMLIGLAAYGKSQDPRVCDIVDYILGHRMPDGGWNCSWNSTTRRATKSSLHTTLSILEGFNEYFRQGNTYKKEEIQSVILEAEAFILNKHLFKSVGTGNVIHPDFLKVHYPTRWKYDVLRAMEYFVEVDRPYDIRMSEALEHLIGLIQKGFVVKGSQYSGLQHFQLEQGRGGRFNTLRTLKVLKAYAPEIFLQVSQKIELPITI